MCAFLSCHKEIIAQIGGKERESCYKSGISDTNFELCIQIVKLVLHSSIAKIVLREGVVKLTIMKATGFTEEILQSLQNAKVTKTRYALKGALLLILADTTTNA